MNTKTSATIAFCAAALPLALLGYVSAAPQSVRKLFSATDPQTQVSETNLHFLALGVLEYEQDQDERLPTASRWGTLVRPYLENSDPLMHYRNPMSIRLFRDPSAPAGVKYSYAFNKNMSSRLFSTDHAPAKTVLLFDSTKNALNATDTGQSVPHPGRHGGGSLYAFHDGHVRWIADGKKTSFKIGGN